MTDQANVLRGLMERRQSAALADAPMPIRSRAHTIAVTSGKGGVGKSNIALNLAIALSQMGESVCLLDANLGLGNIDLLCGLNGYWNLSHVITGARSLADIVLKGPGNVSVIPGASGLSDMADCPPSAQREIFGQLEQFEQTQDFIVIDTGTGIHQSVREFVAVADIVLVVSTPEPTSIADAYATIKALFAGTNTATSQLQFLVNQADSSEQARVIIERLQETSRIFLRNDVGSSGYIPADQCVPQSVAKRRPFLIDQPHAPASRSIRQLAHRMKSLSEAEHSPSAFFPRFRERCTPAAA